MKSLYLVLSLTFTLFGTSAFALNLCGQAVEKSATNARLLGAEAKTYCALTTSKECSIELSASEVGNDACKSSDRLFLSRNNQKGKWSLVFKAMTKLPDLARLSITVNQNAPMEMPAEFLSAGKQNQLKEVHIDQRLSQTIMAELKTAQKIHITVTYGKSKTYNSTVDAPSFKNLDKAFKWVNCMQSME